MPYIPAPDEVSSYIPAPDEVGGSLPGQPGPVAGADNGIPGATPKFSNQDYYNLTKQGLNKTQNSDINNAGHLINSNQDRGQPSTMGRLEDIALLNATKPAQAVLSGAAAVLPNRYGGQYLSDMVNNLGSYEQELKQGSPQAMGVASNTPDQPLSPWLTTPASIAGQLPGQIMLGEATGLNQAIGKAAGTILPKIGITGLQNPYLARIGAGAVTGTLGGAGYGALGGATSPVQNQDQNGNEMGILPYLGSLGTQMGINSAQGAAQGAGLGTIAGATPWINGMSPKQIWNSKGMGKYGNLIPPEAYDEDQTVDKVLKSATPVFDQNNNLVPPTIDQLQTRAQGTGPEAAEAKTLLNRLTVAAINDNPIVDANGKIISARLSTGDITQNPTIQKLEQDLEMSPTGGDGMPEFRQQQGRELRQILLNKQSALDASAKTGGYDFELPDLESYWPGNNLQVQNDVMARAEGEINDNLTPSEYIDRDIKNANTNPKIIQTSLRGMLLEGKRVSAAKYNEVNGDIQRVLFNNPDIPTVVDTAQPLATLKGLIASNEGSLTTDPTVTNVLKPYLDNLQNNSAQSLVSKAQDLNKRVGSILKDTRGSVLGSDNEVTPIKQALQEALDKYNPNSPEDLHTNMKDLEDKLDDSISSLRQKGDGITAYKLWDLQKELIDANNSFAIKEGTDLSYEGVKNAVSNLENRIADLKQTGNRSAAAKLQTFKAQLDLAADNFAKFTLGTRVNPNVSTVPVTMPLTPKSWEVPGTPDLFKTTPSTLSTPTSNTPDFIEPSIIDNPKAILDRAQRASDYYKNNVVPYQDEATGIPQIINHPDPDLAVKSLFTDSSPDQFRRIFNALDSKGQEAVKAEMFGRTLDSASRMKNFNDINLAGVANYLQNRADQVNIAFNGDQSVPAIQQLLRAASRGGYQSNLMKSTSALNPNTVINQGRKLVATGVGSVVGGVVGGGIPGAVIGGVAGKGLEELSEPLFNDFTAKPLMNPLTRNNPRPFPDLPLPRLTALKQSLAATTQIHSQKDYDQLPSGTHYTDSEGNIATKP